MAERRKPLDEIEKLRKEIEALRQERTGTSEEAGEEKPDSSHRFTEELGEFGKRAEKVLESVERAAKKHPLPAVAAALVAGLVLGRIISR